MRGRVEASPILVAICLAARPGAADDNPVDFFERKIRPVLVENCYGCHSATAEKLRGGFLLDTREGIRRGGESGAAVVPGDPDGSLLLRALRHEGPEMPPDGRLSERVIEDFRRWIAVGAPDPRDGRPASAPGSAESAKAWSFRTPREAAGLEPAGPGWARGRIDALVLARLERAGLRPNPPADPRTLIRRVTFDLTGLPPEPAAVERFVGDPSPEAWERVVDRLLASPGYGERWARLWLDVARYAEDQAHIVGNNSSLFYPNAWIYRDWVIDALNDDIPYDRFVELQLAADFIEPDDSPHIAALGFLGLGPKYYSRRNPAVMADEWEDRVDTVTRGLLGLTVACARCHDHKFDPVSTEDYYALAGVFASTEMFNRPLDEKRDRNKNGHAKKPEDAMHVLRDAGSPKDLNVFVRGDINTKGPVVPRRFVRVLCDGEPEPFRNGSGRLELARAIVSPANPLAARVIVNRVWAQLFGRGIVGTPSNFGSLGQDPTHPALLDDLAVRFMEGGWSLKHLIREIVLSSTYRQQSGSSPEKMRVDPQNRLLWRMPRRRLQLEAWRDAILAAAGRLDTAIGGRSVDPRDPAVRRRTLYSRISRLDLNPLLALFDYPDPNVHAARRSRTTTALQKLFVLNSPFMVDQAEALARRLAKGTGGEGSDADRVRDAYRLLYARPPNDEELELGLAFLRDAAGGDEAWSCYVQALLAASEMMYID